MSVKTNLTRDTIWIADFQNRVKLQITPRMLRGFLMPEINSERLLSQK